MDDDNDDDNDDDGGNLVAKIILSCHCTEYVY